MTDQKPIDKKIHPSFVVQTNEELMSAYKRLIGHVTIFHEPKDTILDVLVENCLVRDIPWVEISPKNETRIIQLSFNQDSSPIGREVPDGLVDVSYVRDADCIECAIGPTKYRIFFNSGPKVSPILDSQVPTAYHIKYGVKGGVYGSWLDEGFTPAQQLIELDRHFSTLREYTDLLYPVKKENNLYPFIQLSFSSFENGNTYVDLAFLKPGCLEHVLLKQKVPLEDRAIVLGIHGGSKSSIHIRKISYELQMRPSSS